MPGFRRDVLGAVPWVVAGCLWVVQLFVSWTSAGLLSTSSMLDAVRLIRDGVVGDTVPGWVAPAVLVLPVLGLILIALSAWAGRGAGAVRVVVAALGTATTVAVVGALPGWDPSRAGSGAWCAAAGVALAVVGFLLDRRSWDPPRPGLEALA